MEIKLKVYRGFASDSRLHVSGHVFKKIDPSSFNLEYNLIRYAYNMWRTFNIETISDLEVKLDFQGLTATTKTDNKGYYEFQLDHNLNLSPNWYKVGVKAKHNNQLITQYGEILKAAGGSGIISDIDDTFLVSHSNSIFKKLYVLLTKNLTKRKFFDGVLEHYQQLAYFKSPELQPSLFFYVSSSEWNLYNFIEKFTLLHGFPKAALFLKSIKSGVFDLLFSGGGKHEHKFERIEYIFHFYPNRKFVLLGDDSQKDPFIYSRLTKKYPEQVRGIYIRQVERKPKPRIKELLGEIDQENITNCYFKDSQVAIKHSKENGLIKI